MCVQGYSRGQAGGNQTGQPPATKEIEFLTVLEKSKKVVTILNSEVKGSSVAIVMEYRTFNVHDWMKNRNKFDHFIH